MTIKYIDPYETLAFERDKEYEVLSIEHGWYRIMTELEEDYLFPPEVFEIIDGNNVPPELFKDYKKTKWKFDRSTYFQK